MTILTGTIQKRRDTAANWASINPKLLEGEEGYEIDTGRTKMGDGVTLWNGLTYNSTSQAQTGLVSGGAISTGVFGGNNIRVAAAVWYIAAQGSFSTSGNTDFSVALSTSGTVRYVDFYGDSSNVISKVEGSEGTTASHPAAPANSALIGSVIVTDGSVGIPSGSDTLAEILANGNTVDGQSIKSAGSNPSELILSNERVFILSDQGGDRYIDMRDVYNEFAHPSSNIFTSPVNEFSTTVRLDALTPSKIAVIDANKDVRSGTIAEAAIELIANKDTDATFAANSDTKYPSQKAVKTYVDAHAGGYLTAVVKNTQTISHTGTTAETKVKSWLISAGTFQANDIFVFDARPVPTSNNNNKHFRVYANTSDTLSGATLLALYTIGGTAVFFRRMMWFQNSLTSQRIFTTSSSLANDQTSSFNLDSQFDTKTVNWGANQYLIISLENLSALDNMNIYNVHGYIVR